MKSIPVTIKKLNRPCYECGLQCLESAIQHLLLNYTKLEKENQALCSSRTYIHNGARYCL